MTHILIEISRSQMTSSPPLRHVRLNFGPHVGKTWQMTESEIEDLVRSLDNFQLEGWDPRSESEET